MAISAKKLFELSALCVLILGMTGILHAAEPPRVGYRLSFDSAQALRHDWHYRGAFGMPKVKLSVARLPGTEKGSVLVIESPRGSGVYLTGLPNNLWKKYPIMRWKWRVVRPVVLAPGACEPDDQAGVIYFGDGNMLRQRCVGYRWEATSNIGCSNLIRYGAGTMLVQRICMRNQLTRPGQWVIDERNVVADYRQAFKSDPKSFCILSVGANSQYTRSFTRLEIDYIEFISHRSQ